MASQDQRWSCVGMKWSCYPYVASFVLTRNPYDVKKKKKKSLILKDMCLINCNLLIKKKGRKARLKRPNPSGFKKSWNVKQNRAFKDSGEWRWSLQGWRHSLRFVSSLHQWQEITETKRINYASMNSQNSPIKIYEMHITDEGLIFLI